MCAVASQRLSELGAMQTWDVLFCSRMDWANIDGGNAFAAALPCANRAAGVGSVTLRVHAC